MPDRRLGRGGRRTVSLLLLDLDEFEAVNDRCGHLAADDLLRLIAERLHPRYLGKGFAARLGGDECVLLVPASDEAPLRDLLARLLGDLCPVVTRAGSSVPVSARIGAAWRDEPVQDHSDLLHRADLALYAAKRFARGAARIHRKAEPILPPRNRRLRRTSN